MTALAVERLGVRYGAVEAVRGLSLEVKRGDKHPKGEGEPGHDRARRQQPLFE